MTAKSLPRIPIPLDAYEALATIVELGVDRVERLAALVSAKRGVVQLPKMTEIPEWANELGVSSGALAKAIFDAIIPANSLRLESGLTQDEFVEVFTRSVEDCAKRAGATWKKEYSEAWPKVAAALAPMFAPDNFFSNAIKAAQLAVNQSAIFLDAKMLTELRPIYDEAADTIQTLLMTNTLVLTYSQDGHQRMLHLTMDSDDLRKMASVLDRAEKKNAVAKRQTRDWGIKALAVNSQED